MVFCKLSNKVRNKLTDIEIETEKIKNKTTDKINTNVKKGLDKIDSNKKKIKDKILEKKKKIDDAIIRPYKENKSKNKALMFIIDVCIIIVLILFIFKIYPKIKKYLKPDQKFSEEQYEQAKNLPESAFTKEELRKSKEFRKSYQDWLNYYKSEDAFSDENLGKPDIARGNLLRSPFLFILQYVIPYIIVAYIIWFIVKYIKYVAAAIWGFFIICYQYITKKITCTLAEKWYIRMVTGWSRCSPNFGDYFNDWQNNYIKRPLSEERISYLKGVEQAKIAYQLKYSGLSLSPSKFGVGLWNGFWDWLRRLKLTYIDLPLNELYLQLIDFHPNYIVKPYSTLGDGLGKKVTKIKGDPYSSKTKKGKVCKCPPRKTVYKKLQNYINDIPNKKKAITNKTSKIIRNTNKRLRRFNKLDKVADDMSSCDTYDSIYNKVVDNRKNIGKVVWATMFISTIAIAIYSIFFQYPAWIKNLLAPVYKFTTTYVSKPFISGATITLGIIYVIIFLLLGYYSYLTK